MTEKDARTKWCPFARVNDAGLGNRYPMDNDLANASAFAHCIVSDCMAWRWSYNPEEAQGNVNGPHGYCGLAGKPYG